MSIQETGGEGKRTGTIVPEVQDADGEIIWRKAEKVILEEVTEKMLEEEQDGIDWGHPV